MNKLTFNGNSKHVETLVYSKVHDLWCVQREFDYLHKLLSKTKESPKKVDYVPTGVKGNVKENPKTTTYSGTEDQQELRARVAKIIAKDKRNSFMFNLSKYQYDYSPKQAYWINKYYEDMFGITKANKAKEEKDYTSPLTKEEQEDPNWTPWS